MPIKNTRTLDEMKKH